jgi:hypothetical protein
MTVFQEVKADRIFYDTIWSFRSNQSKEKVIKEVDALREFSPEGNLVSNRGGWQSQDFSKTDDCPTVRMVMAEIVDFTNLLCENERMKVVVEDIHGWANINKQHSYNLAHRHGNRVDFIAVYYPKLPEDSGQLEIHRDGGAALLRQNQNLFNGIRFPLKAEENHVYVFSGHLLHFVHPHPTEELRYSLSFNISCALSD